MIKPAYQSPTPVAAVNPDRLDPHTLTWRWDPSDESDILPTHFAPLILLRERTTSLSAQCDDDNAAHREVEARGWMEAPLWTP